MKFAYTVIDFPSSWRDLFYFLQSISTLLLPTGCLKGKQLLPADPKRHQ